MEIQVYVGVLHACVYVVLHTPVYAQKMVRIRTLSMSAYPRYTLSHTVILFHSFVSLLSFVLSQRDVWHRCASRWYWEDGGLLWQPWKFWGAGTDVQHPKGSHHHRHVTRGSVVHGEVVCPAGCVVLSCLYNVVNMNHSVTVTWHSDEIPLLKWMQLISCPWCRM